MRTKIQKFKDKVKDLFIAASIYTGLAGIITVVMLAILTPLIIAGGVIFLVYHLINKLW